MTTSNLEVLAHQDSPIGTICLRQRELLAEPGRVITEITIDHQMLMSSEHTDSERALSSRVLERHAGEGLRVLVGGLGLGYTAHEILRSDRVASVDVIELLPPVIEWVRNGLVPLSDALNADGRLRVFEADVYAMLAAPPDQAYDVILVDVDHSPDEPLDESSAAFYSDAGLRLAREHLAPGGMLGVWSCDDSPDFAGALRRVFGRVEVEPVSFENRVLEETETNWIFLAQGA